MGKTLEIYRQKFSELPVDVDRDRWPATTNFTAPYKPLLLLSVIDLAANGCLTRERVEFSFDLFETFDLYWKTVSTLPWHEGLVSPCIELNRDGIWRLIPAKNVKPTVPVTLSQFTTDYHGANLAQDLFSLLTKEKFRRQLRETLIDTYFSRSVGDLLVEAALINHGAELYSRQLLEGDVSPRLKTGRGKEFNAKLSRRGFSKAVRRLYDFRCAICGLKLISPVGDCVVDGVYITPRKVSGDDHPANGLCLCHTCGWAFENGYLTIGDRYQVLVSTQARLGGNLPAHLLILTDRVISKPQKKSLRPDPEKLRWHRDNVFRGDIP